MTQPTPTPTPEAAALAAKVEPVLDRLLDAVGVGVRDAFKIGYEAGYRDGAEAFVKALERGEAGPGG